MTLTPEQYAERFEKALRRRLQRTSYAEIARTTSYANAKEVREDFENFLGVIRDSDVILTGMYGGGRPSSPPSRRRV